MMAKKIYIYIMAHASSHCCPIRDLDGSAEICLENFLGVIAHAEPHQLHFAPLMKCLIMHRAGDALTT